jgi:heme-degrading monooxygenase HmoA
MNGPTSGSTQQAGTEFIALSRFTIANGMADQVKDAFINRPHLVDTARGFLRMQVITPSDDPREIWLFTYWRDEASFKAWHRSHLYHDAHRGIPKGLKSFRGARVSAALSSSAHRPVLVWQTDIT